MSDKAKGKTPPSGRPFRAPRFFRNWIGLLGVLVAGSAIFAFILLFAIDIFAEHANPYMGILAYVVAPGFFFTGCSFVFLGYWLQRRDRLKTIGDPTPLILSINLSEKRHRRMLGGFVLVSFSFLLLTAFGSYQTYHVTETVGFCGQACHTPMEPQFATYQHSQHANVECVECHVGPGATAYLKTKINGVRQLWHATLGDFQRPIRLHERDRRPSEETCESCHWREKYTGMVEKTFKYYLADEENTPWSIRMLLNVGGGDADQGNVSGIHWHMNLSNKIEFISPDEGESIPWVRMTDASGKVTEFKTSDFTGDPAAHAIHTMDCMDCHNRPAHKFLSPNDAVNRSMAQGRIDPTMPWVKKNAVEALTQDYSDKDQALQKIGASLRKEYPGDKRTDNLVQEVQGIYQRNFFPEMKSDWLTYPDHLSHKNWAGCFRCHDGDHEAADESTIKASDCTTCHIILAQGSTEEEMQTLSAKGLDFLHIDFEYEDFDCADCHTGANMEEDEEEEDEEEEEDDEGDE